MTIKALSQEAALSAGRISLLTFFLWCSFLFGRVAKLEIVAGSLWKLPKKWCLLSCHHSVFSISCCLRWCWALQRSRAAGTMHLWSSSSVCKIWLQFFSWSNVSSNAYLHRHALYLISLMFLHPLEGRSYKQQCLTVSGHYRCLHKDRHIAELDSWCFFHFPREDLKVLPVQCHIYFQVYSNAKSSLLRREEGAPQKS